MIKKIWNKAFLNERPSISLGLFRIAVAITVGAHLIPSFFHLSDTYFSTALKELNSTFFPGELLTLVQQSPDGVVGALVCLFMLSWFFFLIGLCSQMSCIVMTVCCYYFYALNAFAMGTLSWDILLVTLFLMCITGYHGDYFSVDAINRAKEGAYCRMRPYFLQRLLQLQIGFVFFYTALYKTTANGNWLKDNPIFYIMNYPAAGTTKWFLLRDFLMEQPELCYVIGLVIVVMEYLMMFLLFWRKTRISAIYLGFVFHITLILTLDVPATFFLLFPAQMCLFINPKKVVAWIEKKRTANRASVRPKLLFDGQCRFCRASVQALKIMDLFDRVEIIDFHSITDLSTVHSGLTVEKLKAQIYMCDTDGELFGGFWAFRRLCWLMPMMYPQIFILYFPGAGLIGSALYRLIAKNRYLIPIKTCDDSCRVVD